MTPSDPARFDASRDWRIKYLQLTWNLTRLRRMYHEQRTSAAEFETEARVTLTTCVDLGDWLVAGARPAAVTADDVARLLAGEPLRVCVALARRTATAGADLVPIQLGGAGRAWVEYRRDAVRSVRYDVLDLAERCVASWNWFLTERGVALPTWSPASRTGARDLVAPDA